MNISPLNWPDEGETAWITSTAKEQSQFLDITIHELLLALAI